jgi:hypothetical protein
MPDLAALSLRLVCSRSSFVPFGRSSMSKTNIAAVLLLAGALGLGAVFYAFTAIRAPRLQYTQNETENGDSAASDPGAAMSLGDLLTRSGKPDSGAAPASPPSYLELQLAQSPAPERSTNALALLPGDPTEGNSPSLLLANLTLDARFLLEEKGSAHRQQIEAALQSFDDERFRSDPKMRLTAEKYARLAEALRQIDPEFQAEWREVLQQNYPGLDAVLPHEEP